MGYTHYWTPSKKKTKNDTYKLFMNYFNCMLDIIPDEIIVGTSTRQHLAFNGKDENSHETIVLNFTGKGEWNFCKTACKPYDKLVVACLLLAEELGINESWSSDGELPDFEEGAMLLKAAKEKLKLVDYAPKTIAKDTMISDKLKAAEVIQHNGILYHIMDVTADRVWLSTGESDDVYDDIHTTIAELYKGKGNILFARVVDKVN